MSFKLLNGDRNSGPHTMLLRSSTRPPGLARGQYHSADEEFLCLGGDFTFDGSTWFRKGSYAFYPAYFVHGTKVHVRGGYEVYLRISDTNTTFWEDEPRSDKPYVAAGRHSDDYALQLPRATNFGRYSKPLAAEGVHAKRLHEVAETGRGSTLLDFRASAQGRWVVVETSGLLELFVMTGKFSIPNGDELRDQTYMCRVGDDASVSLQCRRAGRIMISHDAAFCIRSG
ncbi:hypothetical protein HFP57_16060 [Parasphingopyxis algicola]|nr:hypothetical protein [Parasphingopyxis algicola]QLC26394.1 hypothetical protein HFP57_16060 [Parasphingopyxis algicola]